MAHRPAVMVVDDDAQDRLPLVEMLTNAGYDVVLQAGGTREAIELLMWWQHEGRRLDLITTDLLHPGGDGIWLTSWIRRLSKKYTMKGGLRVREIPMVVISRAGDDQEIAAIIARIDPAIPLLSKFALADVIVGRVDITLRRYRKAVLKELDRIGRAIAWDNGLYRVLDAYARAPEPIISTVRVLGDVPRLSTALTDMMLVSDQWAPAERAVAEFERLINDPATREPELQEFLSLNPEFLLKGEFDALWAEPRLGKGRGTSIRPDFVLQPMGLRDAPANWMLVDLKRPDVTLTASRGFHPVLSRQVSRVVQQLKDYERFFLDPGNHEILRSRFGGVVPEPRMMAVIGRLPPSPDPVFQRLRRQEPRVSLVTYDELLELRRASVSRLKAVATRDHLLASESKPV